MKFNKLLLLALSAMVNGVLTLNILAVFPYQGKSHFFVFHSYLKELARRGHNLTVISYFPQEKPIENYHDISLAGKAKILEDVFPIYRSYWGMIQVSLFVTNSGTENCKVLLADENVQNLWKNKVKFDLVVVEMFNSDCTLGLAHALGAPVVGLTSCNLMPWHYKPFGIQYNPAYVSFMFSEGGTKPTLYQRIERTIFQTYLTTLYKYNSQRVDQRTLAQYFDNVPPLEELSRDIKFVLLYSHFVLTGPNLYPPNVQEVGGYHVAEAKPLREDLKKFIEESEHGVIYISFGSMLRATSTPKDKLEAIIGAISELPQRVIWKWEEKTLPGNPKNIFLSNWLPQNDILAHPKVLAFYSHCGMLGTTEAMYHGVPMVGMPVFGDQPLNAAAVEESGLGVQIQVKDLTKESLLEKFRTVLDPAFRSKVKELSKLWKDRPQSAMDSAIYWTEFAARSKKYTFRSPASTVPLYQYLYLDVFAVLGGLLFVIINILKTIIPMLFQNSQKTKLKSK
ncbi:UDP-glucuronosyltransferase 2A3-like [Trichoplusia ni]|uniref:UDP-glucuronosyltransferase 2A3-like n=1 Tax=Trichoplusia ni TaxID=7111 RepID=A0A7E5VPZ5_TRINI|nr:UDP-glucuronosyltransferase 2A3-like [Trichoplusia ni]